MKVPVNCEPAKTGVQYVLQLILSVSSIGRVIKENRQGKKKKKYMAYGETTCFINLIFSL